MRSERHLIPRMSFPYARAMKASWVVLMLGLAGCRGTADARSNEVRERFCQGVERARTDMQMPIASLKAGLSGIEVSARLARRDGADTRSFGAIASPCESYGFALGRVTGLSDGHASALQSIASTAPSRAESPLFSLPIPRIDVPYERAIGVCLLVDRNKNDGAIDKEALDKAVARVEALQKMVADWEKSYAAGLDKLANGCKEAGWSGAAR